MSQEDVELWRATIEDAFFAPGTNEFDPEATISKLAELWDPAVELDASEVPVLDISSVHRGADAARHFWREWFAAWETLQFEYEMVDAGDCVVVLLDLRMRALDGPGGALWEGRMGRDVQGPADGPREALHESVGSSQRRRAAGVARSTASDEKRYWPSEAGHCSAEMSKRGMYM
jgi:SnoaL-like domain